MSNSHHVATYPTEEQFQRWKAEAERLDMTMSEFVASMVEAGQKKFSVSTDPDETTNELRQQRNELKAELDRTRERIERLEEIAYDQEQQEIERFIEENPGATYAEIIQHVVDTVPERVMEHLDELEGEAFARENERYHPIENGDEET